MIYTDGGHIYDVKLRDPKSRIISHWRSTSPNLLECAKSYTQNPFQFEVISIVERKPRNFWLRKILGEY